MAYATTTIDGNTADLAAPKPEQEVDIKSFTGIFKILDVERVRPNGRRPLINMKYPLEKSSVSVKDASEIKKNENSAKVPVTKVQKKVGLMRECRNQF